ncbi:9515_t:CDS:10, partial [Acaulospora colombiana]
YPSMVLVPSRREYSVRYYHPEQTVMGEPVALFPNTSCDIESKFDVNNVIINLTFCGDWAGAVYPDSGCVGDLCQVCEVLISFASDIIPVGHIDFVNSNPSAFSDAYWDIAAIRMEWFNVVRVQARAAAQTFDLAPSNTTSYKKNLAYEIPARHLITVKWTAVTFFLLTKGLAESHLRSHPSALDCTTHEVPSRAGETRHRGVPVPFTPSISSSAGTHHSGFGKNHIYLQCSYNPSSYPVSIGGARVTLSAHHSSVLLTDSSRAVTPPIAFLAERYWSRRTPLLVAIGIRSVSIRFYLEAVSESVALLISSAAVSASDVSSISIKSDNKQLTRLTEYLGIVMTGSVLGFLIGPPLGGVLHAKLGYRAPYIFCIALCVLDLIGRVLVIERETAEKWTHSQPSISTDEQQTPKTDIEKNLKKNGSSVTSTPLAGWISDKVGLNWVTVGSLVLSIPWWILMALPGNLAMLLASLALAEFFLAAVVTPLIADLAASAKELDVGPLIGGYIYSEVKNGWTVMVCFSAALTAVASIAAIFGAGEIPLSTQFLAWIHRTPVLPSNTSITRSTDIFPVISSSKTADGQSITPGQQPTDTKARISADNGESDDTLERLAEAGERYLATPSGSDYYFDTVTTVRGDHSTRASVLTMSNARTLTPDNHTDKNRSSESKQSSSSEKSSIDKKHDILE